MAATLNGQQSAAGVDEAAIRRAVDQALAVAPSGSEALRSPAQAGVRLVTVAVEPLAGRAASHRITIDLSQRALTYHPSGDATPLIDHVLAATARATANARDVEYRILVDGLPYDQFVPRVEAGSRLGTRGVGTPGRVVVSAGHGWYLHEPTGQWRLQREYFWGIVEDFVNHDIAAYLLNELRSVSLDGRAARNPDRGAGSGETGYPRWQESAKYHVRELGAPPAVWDTGADDYAKDINSRPFFANWVDAAAIVSIHNNGGGASGTETWFDTTNPHAAESRRLAEIVNRHVVAAIRAKYNANWPDRGLRSCNGCHGENRLADRPAIIVELAFMDTRSPDNDALHDERFKQLVARAVREALQEWGLKPAAPVEDPDTRARREIEARLGRDPRWVAVIPGSFGADMAWDTAWELRWVEAEFSGGRRVRVFHVVQRNNGAARYVGYWDPDTGGWVGWDSVS